MTMENRFPVVGQALDKDKDLGIIITMADIEYTEDILEAVKENFGYLDGINHQEVATFLECLADDMWFEKGDFLNSVASALRDVGDGVA